MTEDNGVYQHNFYKSSHLNSQKCFICGALERQHIEYSNDNNNLIPQENITPGRPSLLKRTFLNWDSSSVIGNIKRNKEINIEKCDKLFESNANSVEQNRDIIESNENIIQQNNIVSQLSNIQCIICFGELTKEEVKKYTLSCAHYCCRICWFEYLKSKITEAKVLKIPCTSFKCSVILTEEFIMQFMYKCEGKYEFNHYSEGRCKGLQFAKMDDAPAKKSCDCCDNMVSRGRLSKTYLELCAEHHCEMFFIFVLYDNIFL
jgi:hypothetical protein